MGISSSWMRGADCWPVSESGTQNILLIHLQDFWGKDSSRLPFGSKYSTPSWIFRKYRIVGGSWRWFPRPHRQKIDRGKTRSSLVVVRDCCSLPVRAQRCRTLSFFICSLEGNDQWRLSEGFHWWTFVNWQCAIFLPRRRAQPLQKKHLVLLLTFLLSVSKIWCHQE